MRKWSDIKQATLNKLFLDEQEAQQQGHLAKFQLLANECLNFIANGVKSRLGMFKFKTLKQYVVGSQFTLDGDKIFYVNAEGVEVSEKYSNDTIYVDSYIKYIVNKGEFVKLKDVNEFQDINEIIVMPDDFLNFSTVDTFLNNEVYNDLQIVGDRYIRVYDEGEYIVFYNGLWSEISTEDIKEDIILDIDASVLNCLPSYIASQLLSQDDIQRSMIIKNEFELLLARLDTNIMFGEQHYSSKGGWY